MEELVWKIKDYSELSREELYQILKARVEVFVVEQECFYQDLDSYDDKAVHIWAEQNGEIAAYCRIFDQEIKYAESSIGRVLTSQTYRKTGVGKILMKFAVQTIESRFRTTKIRISAQDYLIKFYEGFGFIDTGKKYLEDDIPHTEMLRP